jgi:predicted regulator of Ras-like GTPase activity (Roadblock/LC7/MglB family)
MGDELLLLALVPGWRRIRIRARGRLRFALRAAELAELGLADRITIGTRRIEVTDSRRVEDRRLSSVLHSLGAAAPPPGLRDWLRRTPRSLTVEYLSRLEDRKVIRVRRWRDPQGRTRHDVLSVDLTQRRTLLARLDGVVRAGPTGSACDRDLTLAVLAQAAGLAPAVYPGLRGASDRRRMAALTASLPLAAATGAAPAADKELAAALSAGAAALTRRLHDELGDLYSDATTRGHGLAHDLYPGMWSEGGSGTGHHGGGHGGGHHGGHGAGGDSGGGW